MVIRDAESIINDPLPACHSRRLGITAGAVLANKIAGLIIRKGKRNVKIMPMPSSAIILNMIVVLTQLVFVLYLRVCFCIVPVHERTGRLIFLYILAPKCGILD